MTVDINNKKRRRISAKATEEKEKLHPLSISQSDITVKKKKKRRRISSKDEVEKGTYAQRNLSSMFPDDIMLDILSRLPVKQLMRFRSVSKSWNYLIIRKDQFFINMHLYRSKLQHEKMIFKDYERNYSLYSLDYNQGSHRLERLIRRRSSRLRHIYKEHSVIWGSCNGLICTSGGFDEQDDLYISNPSTREFRKIPYFNGKNIYSCYGFGYNPNTNDYVVVRLTWLRKKGFFSAVSIYSLRNNSWKKIQNIPYRASNECLQGTLVNGSLHWVVESKLIKAVNPIFEFDRADNAILAFEITTENFVEVPCPCPDDHHVFKMIVGQYQGKLCFYHDKLINCSFDLWVMNEYKVRESWTKVFNIRKPKELACSSIDYIVLCSTKEGSIYMRSSIVPDERLILYDPKRRTRRLILGIMICGEVNTYVPSIVTLDIN